MNPPPLVCPGAELPWGHEVPLTFGLCICAFWQILWAESTRPEVCLRGKGPRTHTAGLSSHSPNQRLRAGGPGPQVGRSGRPSYPPWQRAIWPGNCQVGHYVENAAWFSPKGWLDMLQKETPTSTCPLFLRLEVGGLGRSGEKRFLQGNATEMGKWSLWKWENRAFRLLSCSLHSPLCDLLLS